MSERKRIACLDYAKGLLSIFGSIYLLGNKERQFYSSIT